MVTQNNTINSMISIGLGLVIALVGGAFAIYLVSKHFPASRIIMTAVGGAVRTFIPTAGVEVGGG